MHWTTTPYGASKLLAFGCCIFPWLIPSSFYGRIFNAYGEGQFSGNFWPSLRNAAIAGDDFAMTEGTQIRDFILVSDVACHLRIAAERPDLNPGRPMVVNIGTGQGLRIVDFALQQWRYFAATGSINPGAITSRGDQIARLVADTIPLDPQKMSD